MVKLQRGNNQYFITIPLPFVKAKKWEKGQRLIFTINKKGNLEIEGGEEYEKDIYK